MLEKCGDDEGSLHEEQRKVAEECMYDVLTNFGEAGWLGPEGGWYGPMPDGAGDKQPRFYISLISDAKPYL